jgi:hypothetical protein
VILLLLGLALGFLAGVLATAYLCMVAEMRSERHGGLLDLTPPPEPWVGQHHPQPPKFFESERRGLWRSVPDQPPPPPVKPWAPQYHERGDTFTDTKP